MHKAVADAIVEVGRLMYERQYIVATEGNISARLDDQHILATPSGVCKGRLQAHQLVVLDLQGNVVEGKHRASSEIKLHLEVYRQRDDVQGVVHAHPSFCLACMLAGIEFDRPIMAETVVFMGKVPVAPYGRPSTPAVPRSIQPFIQQTDFLLLEHHGSLTVGNSVWDAYFKLEMLERTAQIYYFAHLAGSVKELPVEEWEALLQLRQQVYGVKGRIIPHGKPQNNQLKD